MMRASSISSVPATSLRKAVTSKAGAGERVRLVGCRQDAAVSGG